MVTSEQFNVVARKFPGLERASSIGRPESNQSTFRRDLAARLSRFVRHEWSVALLYLFLDVVSWIAIYSVVGWFRRDAFYATPFQFFVIDLIQLAVIVQALYFIGGEDHVLQNAILIYATEHGPTIIDEAVL